jgi:dTDP-glucose pyrophosphorylase
MIERVVSAIKVAFVDASFVFVVDRQDSNTFSLDNLLVMLGGPGTLVVHKNGETGGALCSALLAIDVLDMDRPLIVSNCDTLLAGDISTEVSNLINPQNDAAVFTFRSMHPRWSYVESGAENIIQQIYEKRVVSDKAVAGLYYFKSAQKFIDAACEVIKNSAHVKGIYFISATINQRVLKGEVVKHVELPENSVFALYSPESIAQYKNKVSGSHPKAAKVDTKVNVIIPAAGLGSRFQEEGWKRPKPFIDVGGQPMVGQVMSNLKMARAHFTVLIREHFAKDYSSEVRHLEAMGASILTLGSLTEGTACTVLAAEKVINNDQMLLIANSDQIVDFDVNEFVNDCVSRDLDGSILVFKDRTKDPKWSFARISTEGLVQEVAEKRPISDLATVGIYLFKTGSSFVSAAIQMIVANERVNNEFYTCPVYNYLIAAGLKIGVFEIPAENMHGIGTPDDLGRYITSMNLEASIDSP